MSDIKEILKSMGIVLGIGLVVLLIIVAFVVGAMWVFGPTDEERSAARVPVAIGQADGCTVYRFDDGGRAHYFTRCGETVTTTKNYSEYCGKACIRPKQEQLTTEGNR